MAGHNRSQAEVGASSNRLPTVSEPHQPEDCRLQHCMGPSGEQLHKASSQSHTGLGWSKERPGERSYSGWSRTEDLHPQDLHTQTGYTN